MRLIAWSRFSLALLLLFPLGNCFGTLLPSVTLAWNPTPSPDVAGYRLYSGVTSGGYSSVIDCGSRTTGTISNIIPGTTYFFAVTAYTLSGLESAFSSELSYSAPPASITPVRVFVQSSPGGTVLLKAAALPGTVFDLLVSTDLKTWTTLASLTADLTGSVQFSEASPQSSPARFYRLRQTSP